MGTHLPSLGALLGELGEHHRLLRVLLLVLLPAGLHKEGIGSHAPPGLSISVLSTRHPSSIRRLLLLL